MKLRLAASVAALAFATPALAQSSTAADYAADVDAQAGAPFLTLRDKLIANVGTEDTVILLYGEWETQGSSRRFVFFVRYHVPGTPLVRMQGARLGKLIPEILRVSHIVSDPDPDVRSVAMVIDHGKATVSLRYDDSFDASLTASQRDAIEIEQVFPGLTLEPYQRPAD